MDDREFDKMLEGVSLPSNAELMRETKYVKVSEANKIKAKNPTWIENNRAGSKKRSANNDLSKIIKQGINEAKLNGKHHEGIKKRLATRSQNPEKYVESYKIVADAHKKQLNSPYGYFESRKEFLEATGLAFNNKMRFLPHLYYYVEDGPGQVLTEKVYYSPFGKYKSIIGIHTIAIAKDNSICHEPTRWFKRMCKLYPDQYYIKIEPRREWLLENKDEQK